MAEVGAGVPPLIWPKVDDEVAEVGEGAGGRVKVGGLLVVAGKLVVCS